MCSRVTVEDGIPDAPESNRKKEKIAAQCPHTMLVTLLDQSTLGVLDCER